MNKYNVKRKIVPVCLLILLLQTSMFSAIAIKQNNISDKELPDPISIDMILETTICRRMSVRQFTDEPVSEETLSTILWSAFGLREDKTLTISKINDIHAAVIYVFTQEALYTYDPINHSLVVYKEGDFRDDIDIMQYEAPIQIGLCWNTTKATANQAGIELGQIGQNIQFSANALDLGTVVTGQIPPAIDPVGIPEDQEGLIIMPLGHPSTPYDFNNKPLWISALPKIQESSTTLSEALINRNNGEAFQGTLTDQEFSQIIWSSYGFSKYIDKSEQEPIHLRRHRTVPSAHGYYPLDIFVVTQDGIYEYYPNLLTTLLSSVFQITTAPVDFFGLPIITFVKQISQEDVRENIAFQLDDPGIATSPLFLVPCLNLEKAKELSIESAKRFWYYEAGAVAHNVLLESTAWDLQSKICYPIDENAIQSSLELPEEIIPLLLLPIGS